ncbi:MAG: hypothetical protein R2764_19465 [Bacteroidales bacterium]
MKQIRAREKYRIYCPWDFEKVVPELVFTNQTDGYKGINYAEVTALLTEAIKEQQKIIETLQKRIEKLEKTNTQ